MSGEKSVTNMNMIKHCHKTRRAGGNVHLSAWESPFEHVVNRAETVACTFKLASSVILWLQRPANGQSQT